MRIISAAAFALAMLSTGCGNSTRIATGGSRGGSTGAGANAGGTSTTSGASTAAGSGTTSGAVTTGGGNTAGGTSTGNLAAGQACGSDAACASGICGVAGSGNCCQGPDPCPLGDAGSLDCGPSGCDDAGACVYPDAGTSCGDSSCFNAYYIPLGNCDGAGNCTPGQGVDCNSYYSCNDAGSCNTSCVVDADCLSGIYCNAHHCEGPRNAGSCTENEDCWSRLCSGLGDGGGIDGGGYGFCCEDPCPQPDPTCPVACPEATGACEYPAGAVCGEPSCLYDHYATYACDQNGICAPNPVLCPGNFGCNAQKTACNTSCAKDTDCASGSSCNVAAGTCSP